MGVHAVTEISLYWSVKHFLFKKISSSLHNVFSLFVLSLFKETFSWPRSGSQGCLTGQENIFLPSASLFSFRPPSIQGDVFYDQEMVNRPQWITTSEADTDSRLSVPGWSRVLNGPSLTMEVNIYPKNVNIQALRLSDIKTSGKWTFIHPWFPQEDSRLNPWWTQPTRSCSRQGWALQLQTQCAWAWARSHAKVEGFSGGDNDSTGAASDRVYVQCDAM